MQLQNQSKTEIHPKKPEFTFSTVSSMLCCSKKKDCKKANRFTVQIPQLADNKKIFKLLDQLCKQKNTRMRAVLLDVNYDQDGALFQRISSSPKFVVKQLKYALDVGEDSLSGTVGFLLSKLIVKLICGSEVRPKNMPHEDLIYRALTIMARMCFSANVNLQGEPNTSSLNDGFLKSQTDCNGDHSPLNSFELNDELATMPSVIAILNLLYFADSDLTPEQFARFVENVVEIGPVKVKGRSDISNITAIDLKNQKLPSPPGWTKDMELDGKIVPLLTMDKIIQECKDHIADCPNQYNRTPRLVACGDAALLALRFGKQHGMLTLGMDGVVISGKKTTRFRVLDIDGNVESVDTDEIANQLVDRLNRRHRPLELQDYPLTAENKFSALLMPKVHSLEELWCEYTKVLPKELQSYSKLMSHYSAALHMLRNELDSTISKQVELLNSCPK